MSKDCLVWIDCEMTGLNPFSDRLLEIAVVLTDYDFNVFGSPCEYVIHQPISVLEAMDEWNLKQHKTSQLWEAVCASAFSENEVEAFILEYLKKHQVQSCSSPLCGNSVHQDRFFLKKWMPSLEKYLHYRNIDVSSFKQVLPMWLEKIRPFEKNSSSHRALDDIFQSIKEMKYYRSALLGRV